MFHTVTDQHLPSSTGFLLLLLLLAHSQFIPALVAISIARVRSSSLISSAEAVATSVTKAASVKAEKCLGQHQHRQTRKAAPHQEQACDVVLDCHGSHQMG